MTIEKMKQRLEEAQVRATMVRGSIADRIRALNEVSALQRQLAAARNQDYAEPIDIGFVPEAAVSGAHLFQSEYAAFLVFNAMKQTQDGSRVDAGTGIVEITRCSVSKFGYPNDEALRGHPLYDRGLRAYGIFEVKNSSWPMQLTQQNRVVFPKTPDSKQRHFIVSFHDSTFECVATSLMASLSGHTFEETVASVIKQISHAA